jgi:hypothetical protein
MIVRCVVYSGRGGSLERRQTSHREVRCYLITFQFLSCTYRNCIIRADIIVNIMYLCLCTKHMTYERESKSDSDMVWYASPYFLSRSQQVTAAHCNYICPWLMLIQEGNLDSPSAPVRAFCQLSSLCKHAGCATLNCTCPIAQPWTHRQGHRGPSA